MEKIGIRQAISIYRHLKETAQESISGNPDKTYQRFIRTRLYIRSAGQVSETDRRDLAEELRQEAQSGKFYGFHQHTAARILEAKGLTLQEVITIFDTHLIHEVDQARGLLRGDFNPSYKTQRVKQHMLQKAEEELTTFQALTRRPA